MQRTVTSEQWAWKAALPARMAPQPSHLSCVPPPATTSNQRATVVLDERFWIVAIVWKFTTAANFIITIITWIVTTTTSRCVFVGKATVEVGFQQR